MSSFAFYKGDSGSVTAPLTCPYDLRWQVWRPTILRCKPRGLPWVPYATWWLFHYLRVFSNRRFAIFLIFDGQTIVHRSVVTPRYFRFPFMGDEDLQIGDTWTRESYRGRGLAVFAIQQIINSDSLVGRKFWYIVQRDNQASIRAAERAGLRIASTGVRKSRFGLRSLGYYNPA